MLEVNNGWLSDADDVVWTMGVRFEIHSWTIFPARYTGNKLVRIVTSARGVK